jgi:hypothetical protein
MKDANPMAETHRWRVFGRAEDRSAVADTTRTAPVFRETVAGGTDLIWTG